MSSPNWAETGRRLADLDRDVEASAERIDQFLHSDEGTRGYEMLQTAANLELIPDTLLLFRVEGKKTSDDGSIFLLDVFETGSERFVKYLVSKKDGSRHSKENLKTFDYVTAALSRAKMRPEAAVNLLFDKLDKLSEHLDATLDEIGPAVEIRHPSGIIYL